MSRGNAAPAIVKAVAAKGVCNLMLIDRQLGVFAHQHPPLPALAPVLPLDTCKRHAARMPPEVDVLGRLPVRHINHRKSNDPKAK